MTDAIWAGVVGDGVTMNTTLIQKAIDECSAAGGGTIAFSVRILVGLELGRGLGSRFRANLQEKLGMTREFAGG